MVLNYYRLALECPTCNNAKPDPLALSRTSLVSAGRILFCITVGLFESTLILLTVFKYVYCKFILLLRSVSFSFLLISLSAVMATLVSTVDAKPENDDIQDSWGYLTNYIKINLQLIYSIKRNSVLRDIAVYLRWNFVAVAAIQGLGKHLHLYYPHFHFDQYAKLWQEVHNLSFEYLRNLVLLSKDFLSQNPRGT